MTSFRRRLPPVNALVTFEAVARHLSFTHGARELGVSQAATSRQVRILEDHLGARLFDRDRRRIRLTPAGDQLHLAVSMAFSHIAGATDSLRRGGRSASLTVATSVAFSVFWLIPRLGGFHAAHPEVELRLVSSDAPNDWFVQDVDLAVVFGDGRPPGLQGHDLFGDRVIAVCGPGYLAGRPAPRSVSDLPGETLLHMESDIATWLDWPSWLARCGLEVTRDPPGPHFNNYAITIQAALEGRGIALGWRRLIEPHLRDGRLVQVTPGTVIPDELYVLVTRDRMPAHDSTRAFRDWIIAEAERDWT